jgi:hypothetical protein
VCKGTSVVRLVESKNSGEVGNRDKIFEEHVHERAFTPFCYMLLYRAKAKNQKDEDGVFIRRHGTVVSTNCIKLCTTFGLAAVANGGGSSACGKGFCVKNSALVEVEVFVGDVIAKVADDTSFDRMGCCTPFVGGGGKYIEAAWMRETKYLCLEFVRSLGGLGIGLSILMWFSGGGNVHGERNEGRMGLRGISSGRDGGGKEVIRVCNQCHYAVVEDVEPFKLHPTSMSYIHLVFEHLRLFWMSIWLHTHTVQMFPQI